MLSVYVSAAWRSSWSCIHCKAARGSRKWTLENVVRRASTSSVLRARDKVAPVFSRAAAYGEKVGIVDHSGSHSYDSLYNNSRSLAGHISRALACPSGDLQGRRISFLCANDASYTVAQWATWMCGGIAVPLYRKHPLAELEYIISDSESSLLLAGHPHADTLEPLAQKLGLPCLQLPPTSGLDGLRAEESPAHSGEALSDWAERPAMLVYTSGTTGRPKGVLHTHSSLQAMVNKTLPSRYSDCTAVTELSPSVFSHHFICSRETYKPDLFTVLVVMGTRRLMYLNATCESVT